MKCDDSDTSHRIRRLEKEQRLWRLVAIILVTCMVGMGAEQPQNGTMSIRQLLVTNGGKAQTRIQPDGVLLFHDGKLRATLGAESDSAAVRLFDQNGKPTITLHVTEGRPQLQIAANGNEKLKVIDFSEERLDYQKAAQ